MVGWFENRGGLCTLWWDLVVWYLVLGNLGQRQYWLVWKSQIKEVVGVGLAGLHVKGVLTREFYLRN